MALVLDRTRISSYDETRAKLVVIKCPRNKMFRVSALSEDGFWIKAAIALRYIVGVYDEKRAEWRCYMTQFGHYLCDRLTS